jgi:tRNA-2-methylthio-N6-dimethylallyladenosine synthase
MGGDDVMASKTVFVKTFGCQMNVYDSERMSEALAAAGGGGYREVDTPDAADLIILNTCHIRDKAVEKVYSDLGRMREIKTERAARGERTVIAVAGCVAQAEGEEIMRRQPAVDIVVGPQSYHQLPDLVAASSNRSAHFPARFVETSFPEDDKFRLLPARTLTAREQPLPGSTHATTKTAFLTVQEGCDKFCTFCVVPYTRGAEYSRSVSDIVTEARRLVARGVVEITLLGQNVNGYHGAGLDGAPASLARLLDAISEIDGLERLRYTTSHPRDMSDDLIAAHRDQPKLMPFLHLPVQSGADRILAAMNRKHTSDHYRSLVQRIRTARPDIALSTDIIVGFPGETEAEFRRTLDLVEETRFAMAFSFKYSPRPGTPAASLDGAIPDEVASERLTRLQGLLNAQAGAFNAGLIGRTVPVLFERQGRRDGQLMGRSPYLQVVTAPAGAAEIGRIVPVEITGSSPHQLTGVLAA